ncbi:mttA/Hcf106 family-domain-containing protein [Scenedesmus sp. NREL 46B-D3]|nr:mttA/Hcf106 family-domain-containing protein [Scenedesmus sp. NREL 46B-D3]
MLIECKVEIYTAAQRASVSCHRISTTTRRVFAMAVSAMHTSGRTSMLGRSGASKPRTVQRPATQLRSLVQVPARPFSGSSLTASPLLQRQQQRGVVCQGLFGLGLPEIAVIAGVAALIFGPSKLPELGKGLGKTVRSFQTAAEEFKTELETAAKGDDEEAAAAVAKPAAKQEEKKEVAKSE